MEKYVSYGCIICKDSGNKYSIARCDNCIRLTVCTEVLKQQQIFWKEQYRICIRLS